MSTAKPSAPAVSASHKDMANAIRALSMDAVLKANSGHMGMPMGMADVATVLFTQVLKYDPRHPEWPDRDRFVLSAGHGSMLLYALLYLTGYADIDIEQIKTFRQIGARTAGHPEFGHAGGIETTTGPLGQGLANAVGMALAERMLNARHGDAVCNHFTYVIAGDGCLMEGISHEAISLAGHLQLNKLIVLFDDNQISIDGPTSLAVSDDQTKRFEASGWTTLRCDGQDAAAVAAALKAAQNSDRPVMIACRTIIGYGAGKKQGTAPAHGLMGADDVAAARQELGWNYPPFVVPEPILASWKAAGARGAVAFAAWERSAGGLGPSARARLADPLDAEATAALAKAVVDLKTKFAADKPTLATRVSSQHTLEKLIPALPALVGGSADLTGSVGTKTSHYKPVKAGAFAGNYLHYGVREHGMAAAMNGITLHGGLVPFGGTFLVFTDYARPAIRLSALMGLRVVYVMTHDSIGLGEDGPTHQSVEQLASLRAMPNLHVLRPADAVEVAECWQIALTAKKTPSILALSRQNVPTLRAGDMAANRSAKGAYVLRDASGKRDLTIIATGSEVQIAMDAAVTLAAEGVKAAVVSMPASDIFDRQTTAYRKDVLGTAPRIGIEAGCNFGWERWLGADGIFIGMPSFGASGPYEKLYDHFGITAAKAVEAAHTLLKGAKS